VDKDNLVVTFASIVELDPERKSGLLIEKTAGEDLATGQPIQLQPSTTPGAMAAAVSLRFRQINVANQNICAFPGISRRKGAPDPPCAAGYESGFIL
jgi:hypothetical protein